MISQSLKSFFTNLLAALALLLAGSAWAASSPVDVNKASQAELQAVKGIGPGLSGRILEARAGGAFKNWNDMIERVQGVGPGNAARFSKAGLTVAGTGFDGAGMVKPANAKTTEASAKPAKGEKTAKDDKPNRSTKADRPTKS